MANFDEIVASRRRWIDDVLTPWCRAARRADLLRAALEWGDLAGRVDPNATLWTWAWSRFPALIHEGISGVNETLAVIVTLHNGQTAIGYPDARQSTEGRLVLIPQDPADVIFGPVSIDEIAEVKPLSVDAA